jgi:hypothetical protein
MGVGALEWRISMTNKDFYAFCRANRKTEPDEHKRAVLQDVYNFMWECGVSKNGVENYIAGRIRDNLANEPRRHAYLWLQGVFGGTVSATEPSGTLF